MTTNNQVYIRSLRSQDYLSCWQAMQQFTQQRHTHTSDEIWLIEHPAVYTQGQNGRAEHLLQASSIPIVQTDRGGQITYHGPGQLVCYTLVDLKRKQLNIREFVRLLEQSVIDLLADHQVLAYGKCEAPGIYVQIEATEKKIASLGLRVKRGCTYHGLALNIKMDLSPFASINPCGFAKLKMTQLAEFNQNPTVLACGEKLVAHLVKHLHYLQVYYD